MLDGVIKVCKRKKLLFHVAVRLFQGSAEVEPLAGTGQCHVEDARLLLDQIALDLVGGGFDQRRVLATAADLVKERAIFVVSRR